MRLLAAALLATLLATDGGPRVEPSTFTAWLVPSEAYVHRDPNRRSAPLAILERGNQVEVVGCTPACEAKNAWALLAPRGAIPLEHLSRTPIADAIPLSAPFTYGHARAGAAVLAAPDAQARTLRRERGDGTLAFVEDPELLAKGWLHAVDGGYLAAKDVRLIGPSDFAGVHDPAGPLVFFIRDTKLRAETVPGIAEVSLQSPDAGATLIPRHSVLAMGGLAPGDRVRVPGGSVARSAVRLAKLHPRPEGVPEGARWVHVDLQEQVLTAYEGDRPVFATLISSGKSGFPTPSGLFRVWYKTRHTTMNGRREPYHVEQVPDVMYFHGSDGLHGAFWHDRFGRAGSHGCVNLSPADARWLFDWAPPEIPAGWHGVLVQPEDTALWVQVEGPSVRAELDPVDEVAPEQVADLDDSH